MKHLIAAAILALLASVTNAQTKVGYIDIDQITRKSKPVSGMMDKIKDEIETIQKEIATRDSKVRELRADLKKNEGVLSAGDLDAKRKEITRLQNELDEFQMQGKRKAQEMDSRVLEPMLKTILFRVEDVAKEKGFDLVLRGEAVIYGTKAVDLTDAVIEKLNAEGGTAGPSNSDTPSAKSETTPKAEATPKADASPAPTDNVLPLGDAPKEDKEAAPKKTASAPAKSTAEPAKKAEPTKAPAGRTRAVDRQPEL